MGVAQDKAFACWWNWKVLSAEIVKKNWSQDYVNITQMSYIYDLCVKHDDCS